jgi:hypothetical protein
MPLGRLQMVQSLKTRFYGFHFRHGSNFQNTTLGGVEVPEALTWLWRVSDPEKTSEVYEQEATERAQALLRLKVANRTVWWSGRSP